MDTPIHLIVGLGNPGKEYENTRHNAGEDFVREVAYQHNITLSADKKYFGLYGKGVIEHHTVHLLIPTTFMNRSGQAVGALANFFKIEPKAILVAHDELDLDPGISRLKIGGGHGGHNGLRDIITALGNCKDFARLRIGIGHPGDPKQVSNFVLKKAPSSEYQLTEASTRDAIKQLPALLQGNWNQAMKELHTQG
jgi:PTH1 family peptidyl-tRNA hydrolase